RPSLDVDSFAMFFSGDTNRPDNSTFGIGEKVQLTFHITGGAIEPKQPLTLALQIVDERDQQIETKTIPVKVNSEGEWDATIDAPTPRLGFYRVKAKLSD